jgi:hypothetical protein
MRKIQVFIFCLVIVINLQAKDYNDLLAEQKHNASVIHRIGNSDLSVTLPDFIFENTNTKIELQFADADNSKLIENNYQLFFILNGQEIPVQFDKKGHGVLVHSFSSGENANLMFEDFSFSRQLSIISLWMIGAPVGFVFLLIVLRLLNQRAKNKTARNNKLRIEAKKNSPAKKTDKIPAPQEEELIV